MPSARALVPLTIAITLSLISGCADDTAGLKQQIVGLEKRLAKQEKEFNEFVSKYSPTKDFSVDVRRIEDQQERVADALQAKVDPINSKLEEFRDWAQESQKTRESLVKRLGATDEAITELNKRFESTTREIAKLAKEEAANEKRIKANSKSIQDAEKTLAQLGKDMAHNHAKLVEAVNKALPKVKSAAVDEMKGSLEPLEKRFLQLKAGLEKDLKALEEAKGRAGVSSPKELTALRQKLKELEEIVASQKTYLLDLGSKVHDLERPRRR